MDEIITMDRNEQAFREYIEYLYIKSNGKEVAGCRVNFTGQTMTMKEIKNVLKMSETTIQKINEKFIKRLKINIQKRVELKCQIRKAMKIA